MTENKLVPKRRFKEFKNTDAWEQRKLGEVTESFDGKRIPIDSGLRVSGEYPYYGATGIIDYVDDYIFDGEYVLLAEDGANIIMRNYPVAYLTQGKFWLNNHAHIMRMIDGSNYFLVQVLEKIDYMKYNTGTAQPKLNSKIVKNIEFKLPHIEEQQKIGNFFQQLDNTIALHQRKLKKMKSLKTAYLSEMFPAEGEKKPKRRFKGFTDDWEQHKLREIAKTTIGEFVIKSKQNPASTYPVYNGGVSYTGFYDEYNNEANKIVISARGANAGFVNLVKKKYWAGNSCYSVEIIREKEVDLDYLYQFMKHTQHLFTDYQQTANIPSVSKKDVETFEVHFPVFNEQRELGKFLSAIDNTMTLHQNKLEKLQNLKKAYLNEMFV